MQEHVLRLITRLNIGGPARQALLLTKALRPSYVTTLAAGTPGPEEGELQDPDVDVVRIPLVRSLSPMRDVRSMAAVHRLLKTTKPAILHTHMAKAGSIGRSAASVIRPRPLLIHTFHGHVLEGYFAARTNRVFVSVERALARRTDALIAVSAKVRDDLLALGIGSPDRFHVIPLGLELEPFLDIEQPSGRLRAELDIGADVPLLGIAGRLVPIKDHDTALRALLDLLDAHLVVLGDGELRPQIEATIARLGLQQRVHMAGWRDMSAVLGDIDVMVLTSRNEGTPVSLIEAHAAGKPAVATDVGGVRDVVRDGVTGYVVPAGNPHHVAKAVRALLDDVSLRKEMGARGRRHVAEHFGGNRLVSDIKDLYRELLAQRARRT